MTYIIKVQIYTPSIQDPDNLETKEFWDRLNLFFESPRRIEKTYKLNSFFDTSKKIDKPIQNKFLDRLGNPVILKLEFDIQPGFFRDLEKAGLKIGQDEDVEVSILAISDLGITLSIAYYPYDQEKELLMFDGSIFIPIHRLVSIEHVRDNAIENAYINKAILNGNVEIIDREKKKD